MARPRKRENKVEAYLVKRVDELNGEIRKVKWVSRSSAPDRRVMLPAMSAEVDGLIFEAAPRSFWVELKAEGLAAEFPHNAHERAQHREHERLRKFGDRVEVIDSFERVDEVLKTLF